MAPFLRSHRSFGGVRPSVRLGETINPRTLQTRVTETLRYNSVARCRRQRLTCHATRKEQRTAATGSTQAQSAEITAKMSFHSKDNQAQLILTLPVWYCFGARQSISRRLLWADFCGSMWWVIGFVRPTEGANVWECLWTECCACVRVQSRSQTFSRRSPITCRCFYLGKIMIHVAPYFLTWHRPNQYWIIINLNNQLLKKKRNKGINQLIKKKILAAVLKLKIHVCTRWSHSWNFSNRQVKMKNYCLNKGRLNSLKNKNWASDQNDFLNALKSLGS